MRTLPSVARVLANFRASDNKNVPRPPVANRSPSGETWQE